MHLSAADVARIAKLKGRNQILLYLAALTRVQWWGTAVELATIACVPQRRAELELAALVSSGLLERKGQGRGTLARFRLVPPSSIRVIEPVRSERSNQNDRSDRTGTIETIEPERSKRSTYSSMDAGARARAPDLSLDPRSMEQRVRPSGEVLGGDDPAADGRTDGVDPRAELRNALVLRVAARWQLTARIVTPGLLRLLNVGATERELQAFLVDAERGTHPAFDGVGEENRFGRSCTTERFAVWRKSREPRRAAPRDREPELELEPRMSSDEVEAFAELAKREMARARRP